MFRLWLYILKYECAVRALLSYYWWWLSFCIGVCTTSRLKWKVLFHFISFGTKMIIGGSTFCIDSANTLVLVSCWVWHEARCSWNVRVVEHYEVLAFSPPVFTYFNFTDTVSFFITSVISTTQNTFFSMVIPRSHDVLWVLFPASISKIMIRNGSNICTRSESMVPIVLCDD